jgi:hypothetical protein
MFAIYVMSAIAIVIYPTSIGLYTEGSGCLLVAQSINEELFMSMNKSLALM